MNQALKTINEAINAGHHAPRISSASRVHKFVHADSASRSYRFVCEVAHLKEHFLPILGEQKRAFGLVVVAHKFTSPPCSRT